MWQNLKTKARDAKTLDAQKKWTGGGPAPPAIGSQDSQVLAIIPSVMPSINIEIDSDVNQPSTSQLDQENDNDSMYWKNKKNRNEIEVIGEENTHSLPGWPLQEPAKQIPAAVLKKTKVEETVEDLKKELLKKEIEKVAQQILHEKEKHEIELEILKIRKDLLKKLLND
ncbi:PREDICTED: uncharacterized protein LOC106103697 [Papilio polytes]|uniref:uncharacterized protein LOC106103697 n=1 Tax=Papilio polytes TaxID=76194 RepID=UPI000675ED49|nr:PREDICTED: uncharacterized protein LOC106103697 [Papilio polytes]